MLECRACLLRHIRAVVGKAHCKYAPDAEFLSSAPPHTKAHLRHYSVNHSQTTAIDVARNGLTLGRQPIGDATTNQKALKIELRYLQDPIKLAEHVQYTLRCGKPDKALDLCRLASKRQEVIVSWNHCVDWYMSRGKIQEAIKIYNEMKKRAQFPDSHTYRILLSGLAKRGAKDVGGSGKDERYVNSTKALAIYYSMNGPTSRVKPNLFHTNAVLNACNAERNLDGLWSVLAKLPKHGPTAPDHITYATVLHGIRNAALVHSPDGVVDEQRAARRQKAVQEGRQLWQDIIPRWRTGEFKIDEELVCAMGSLLLISMRLHDWDDVLNLVWQTMQIERQAPTFGSEQRHTNHIPLKYDRSVAVEAIEDREGFRDAPSTRAFDQVRPPAQDASKSATLSAWSWVQPGNRTLSMLVQACTALRIPKAAKEYWRILTDPEGTYKVRPDAQNYQAQLQLFGINRASASAAALIKEMVHVGAEPKNQTFRMAMYVCTRDIKNHRMLENAGDIVAEMSKHQSNLDVHSFTEYMKLASKVGNSDQLKDALERMDPVLEKISSETDATTRSKVKDSTKTEASSAETLTLLQKIMGVTDELLEQKPATKMEQIRDRRKRVTILISKIRKSMGNEERAGSLSLDTRGRSFAVYTRPSDAPQRRTSKEESDSRTIHAWKKHVGVQGGLYEGQRAEGNDLKLSRRWQPRRERMQSLSASA